MADARSVGANDDITIAIAGRPPCRAASQASSCPSGVQRKTAASAPVNAQTDTSPPLNANWRLAAE